MGSTCTNCFSHATYDYSQENGVTFTEIPNSSGQRSFGAASSYGFEARDQVCLVTGTSGSCTQNQDIFIITQQIGFPISISGVIGLSTGATGGPSLIKSLYDSGAISDPIFAFTFRSQSQGGNSYLDIGVMKTSRMSNPSDMVTVNTISGDSYWSNYVTGIKFGSDVAEEWLMV